MKAVQTPKFKPAAGSMFFHELKQAVEGHFKQRKISKFANTQMVSKTVILLLAYFGSYAAVLIWSLPIWVLAILCIVMGLAMAGIGMGIMHDANHGSYSKNRKVNKILGRTADILGVSSNNWINQHNKLHHTFTNIYEHDEDINGKGFFRFSPDAPRKRMHAFQHIYWVALYGLLTLGWFVADFKAYGTYKKKGLNRSKGKKAVAEFSELLLFKLIYVGYMIVIPILFTSLLWWQVIIGFILIHFVAGMVLSVVFQLAHVVDAIDHHHHGEVYDEWAIHQIQNTVNFATGNRLLGWYCGGLNFQVEHHLFPHICHIHYPKINQILKEVANKHQVKYIEFSTFSKALGSHLRLLRSLGKAEPIAA